MITIIFIIYCYHLSLPVPNMVAILPPSSSSSPLHPYCPLRGLVGVVQMSSFLSPSSTTDNKRIWKVHHILHRKNSEFKIKSVPHTRYSINLLTTALVSDRTSTRSRSARLSLVQVSLSLSLLYSFFTRPILPSPYQIG